MAYLANSLIYLFAKGNIYIIIAAFIGFSALNVLSHADILPALNGFLRYFSTIYGGTIPALTAEVPHYKLLNMRISYLKHKPD